ncbi:hypothetical protein GCM10009736_75700 [Actinomadura bangladeshensis]
MPITARGTPATVRRCPVVPEREISPETASAAADTTAMPDMAQYLAIRPSVRVTGGDRDLPRASYADS